MPALLIVATFAVLIGLSLLSRRRLRRRILESSQVPGAPGLESPTTAANITRATIDATNARGNL
jgi:hypothetical protein